jgi:hypothetical protein
MVRTLLVAISLAALIGTASAQDLPGDQPTPKPSPPPTTQVVTPPPPPPSPPRERGVVPPGNARNVRGRDLNVQIEITITDQGGSGTPEKKVVSLLAADQSTGRVRAQANARQSNVGMVGSALKVDARPIILDNDRIMLELTLEYMPVRDLPADSAKPASILPHPTELNESLSVILQSGKPLIVSQAADPLSDRRMTVEVRATVLK